jgi:iron only hydrogenase large subunit-like protein
MEVDTVLATHEIADLLSKKKIDFQDIKINTLLDQPLGDSNNAVLSILQNS